MGKIKPILDNLAADLIGENPIDLLVRVHLLILAGFLSDPVQVATVMSATDWRKNSPQDIANIDLVIQRFYDPNTVATGVIKK